MKQTFKICMLTFILMGFFACPFALFGANETDTIKFIEKVGFLSPDNPLKMPWSFSITEDSLFLIPDQYEGKIRVYEKNGKGIELVNSIGRKGYCNGELVDPAYCTYVNGGVGKFALMDIGLRYIMIYDRLGRKEFKRVKEVYCQRLGEDIQIVNEGHDLWISGYAEDALGAGFELYSVNLEKGEKKFYLPSYKKLGLSKPNSEQELKLKKALGVKGWFDIGGNYVFFAWEATARIIKLDLNSGEIIKTFGQETATLRSAIDSDFIKKQIAARKQGDFVRMEGLRYEKSFITNLFTSKEHVYLVYEGPGKGNFRLQAYTLDGVFIGDVPIPGNPDARMCFDKKRNILYSLIKQTNDAYAILVYQVQIGG